MTLKLSVVDQSPVHACHAADEAPALTIELAQQCDRLGYHRIWVAEHHNSLHFANPCPEILVASIAAVTDRIRVGSGGVMLSHYSPYKVAEIFRMLASLHKDRIDLGIGRAPGGGDLSTSALAWPSRPVGSSIYAEQAQLLAALLDGDLPDGHPYANLTVMPNNCAMPERWMLGSSGGSARLAGQLGYRLGLARFIAPDHCAPSIFREYRDAWNQAGHGGEPQTLLAIACICAETKEEATLRASTAAYRKYSMQVGIEEPFLSPENVQDRYRNMSAMEQARFDHILEGYTVGTPDDCLDEIHQLSKQFDTGEIAIVCVTYTQREKLDSLRLLAKAAAL